MMGGWQVTPTVGFPCFLVFYVLLGLLSPTLASCLHGNRLINLLFTYDSSIL